MTIDMDMPFGEFARKHLDTTSGSNSAVDRLVSPDWQVLALLPGGFIVDIDCNSGRKRRLKESQCRCGQDVLIQLEGNRLRLDGKRVFYPDEPDKGADAFRCKSCHAPVSESVPGAEYGEG